MRVEAHEDSVRNVDPQSLLFYTSYCHTCFSVSLERGKFFISTLYTSCWVGSEWMLSQGSGLTSSGLLRPPTLNCPSAALLHPAQPFLHPLAFSPQPRLFSTQPLIANRSSGGWEWIMSKAPLLEFKVSPTQGVPPCCFWHCAPPSETGVQGRQWL